MGNLISVVIPCFNQAEYLQFAVDSVIRQTISDWECIIVNDGSSDDSLAMANQLSECDSRIKIIDQCNLGASAARNTGIEHANGEFILPLDADDAISPNYLESCLNMFLHNPDLILVYGKAQNFGKVTGEWILPPYDYQSLLSNNMIHCTALYRKTSWVKAGGYDSKMIHGFEDWEFWVNILDESSKVICDNCVTFFYRIKNASRQISMSGEQIELMRQEIYLKHYKKYNHLFKDPIALYHQKEVAVKQFQLLLNRPDWYLKQLVKRIVNR